MYLHFPNRVNLPRAISALQHIPFKIETSGALLPSLIVLPQNDKYWKCLGVAARRTRQWSIPVAMNIVWVLVAFLFTVVDSFVDFDYFLTVPGDAGYSIAAVWTYLLPVVVGWLHVGSQPEAEHLHDALNEAHEMAFVATSGDPIPATQIPNRFTRAIEPSTRLIDYANADEKKTAPIFNYARVFIWSQYAEHILRLYEHAAERADQRITVDGGIWASTDVDAIVAQDRSGNEAEVMHYCTPMGADVPRPFSQQIPLPHTTYTPAAFPPNDPTKEDEENGETVVPVKPVFATEVFHRITFATILALGLQWGTTGASVLIHIFTPPKGLGCRALTFSVYGSAGTVSFFLVLISSILAHSARLQTPRGKRSAWKILLGCLAAITRWLGKTIAMLNGLGLLLTCGMQFGGMYDNCFCSSTIFGGDPNGLVKFVGPDIKGSEVYGYWIGGIVMAFGVSIMYIFAIYVATPMGWF